MLAEIQLVEEGLHHGLGHIGRDFSAGQAGHIHDHLVGLQEAGTEQAE